MRWVLIMWLCLAAPAYAQVSVDEQRARDIGAQLRCVVCQNQSIEESDAQLAQDMRRQVRDRIAAGETNEQVIDHIRGSYGDYVLLKPPVQSNTFVLWGFPFALLLISFIWFLSAAQRKAIATTDSRDLSDQDKALLDSLMEDTP